MPRLLQGTDMLITYRGKKNHSWDHRLSINADGYSREEDASANFTLFCNECVSGAYFSWPLWVWRLKRHVARRKPAHGAMMRQTVCRLLLLLLVTLQVMTLTFIIDAGGMMTPMTPVLGSCRRTPCPLSNVSRIGQPTVSRRPLRGSLAPPYFGACKQQCTD